MDRPLAPHLRIVFEKPGFFLADTRMVVALDGSVVFDGGFMGGVDVGGAVSAGWHRIQTRIYVGPLTRERDYAVEVPAGPGVTVVLEYSRLWGNFTKAPRVVAHGG